MITPHSQTNQTTPARTWLFTLLWGALCAAAVSESRGQATQPPPAKLCNVLDFGAKGDGRAADTAAINNAIIACAAAGGGQVLLPPGTYLSGTVHLRSGVTLFLAAGATLAGITNLTDYQQPDVPASMPEAKWGKWHRALVLAEGVEDAGLAGPGTIDGRKVFDPTGEERMRGPHTIVMVNCRRFSLRDLTILDSANYAVFFQLSDDVEIRSVKFHGGWDGVHFRGSPDRWCRGVKIIGCQFCTGDDAIAGRYWDNVVISDCILNSSCNGIRLIGPATRLIVSQCLFYGPGEAPHRTSTRTNMLSGIILQPGAWDATEGLLNDVLLAQNVMRDVASPVTIWTKSGNPVGRITISGLDATGVYRSALSVESWANTPVTNVVIRNAAIEFTGGGALEQAKWTVKGPGVDARPLPAWGVYARNVESLTLEDVRLTTTSPDLRPVVVGEKVGRIRLDHVRAARASNAAPAIIVDKADVLELKDTDLTP